MKQGPSNKIVTIAVVFYFILTLLYFLINYFSSNLTVSLIITTPCLLLAYILFTHIYVSNYIKSKIQPIYKSIRFSNNKSSTNQNKDPFNQMSDDVAIWMKGKTQEIQQLKQMEEYRKNFLGNVSHELKTPIFNIQGYILTLLDGGLEDEDINMLYLKRSEKSIDRMISIIEDLEAISKLEAGELEIKKERFNIFQLIEDVFDMQDVRAKKNNIKLILNKEGKKALYVNADKGRMFQVFNNLVLNSINYGKNGGTTQINTFDIDGRYLIEVEDDGIGIKEEDLPRVFERFYRADKSRSRAQGGTGLGLAIVKHIIEAHNQTINVTSTFNEGTSFTITLDKS